MQHEFSWFFKQFNHTVHLWRSNSQWRILADPLLVEMFCILTPACMLNCFSRVQLFATLWTAAHQALLSVGFSRQEYWGGLPYSSSTGSYQPKDWTHVSYVSCTGQWVLHHQHHLGSPLVDILCPFLKLYYSFVRSSVSSVQFSHSVESDSATPWIAAHQASLSITNSRSSLRLTSIECVMPSSHLILCCPFLLLPPIPLSIRVCLGCSKFHSEIKCLFKSLSPYIYFSIC